MMNNDVNWRSDEKHQAIVHAIRAGEMTQNIVTTALHKVEDTDLHIEEETASEHVIGDLRAILRDERTALSIQRATAEQARRVADRLRACHEALLASLCQPCCVLDCDAHVIRWNLALATWSGVPSENAVHRPVREIFGESSGRLILAGIAQLRASGSIGSHRIAGPLSVGGRTANAITLIPQERTPGFTESIIALIEG